MKLKVFSAFDSKAELFLNPFFMKTKGEALRAWVDAVNNPQTPMFKHPADFTLFEIGEWDDSNAKLESYVTPISLGLALEFKKDLPPVGDFGFRPPGGNPEAPAPGTAPVEVRQ